MLSFPTSPIGSALFPETGNPEIVSFHLNIVCCFANEHTKHIQTIMWANAQPDGRPAKHRGRPLFNAAKFG